MFSSKISIWHKKSIIYINIFVIINFFLLKITFKKALKYFFNVVILFNKVFYLKLKIRINPKMCNFNNLEDIWQKHLEFLYILYKIFFNTMTSHRRWTTTCRRTRTSTRTRSTCRAPTSTASTASQWGTWGSGRTPQSTWGTWTCHRLTTTPRPGASFVLWI